PTAGGQGEAGDAGLPAVRRGSLAGRGVVLIDVPEGAVVDRVHRQVGVVAPPGIGGGLHAGTVDDRGFAERHLPALVAGEASGVADAGEHVGAVDHAVPQRHVALAVHGDAAHPPVDAVA